MSDTWPALYQVFDGWTFAFFGALAMALLALAFLNQDQG